MNKTLTATIIAAFLTASAVSVVAGPGKGGGCPDAGNHGRGHGDMMMNLDRIVDLTDAQKAELATMRKEMRAERGNVDKPRQRQGLYNLDSSAADYQQQVNALADEAAERARERVLRHAKRHAKVQSILTDEQKAELQAFHQERKSFHDKWGKPGKR